MDPLIETHRDQIVAMAKRNGLRDVRVFGSMARGDADESSDVDLLVTRPAGTRALALFRLATEAEKLLGRRVDVLTEGCLYHMIRERVLRESKRL